MKKNRKVILYYNLIFLLVLLIGISSFFFTYFFNLIDTDISYEKLSVRETSHINYSVKEINSNTYNHINESYPIKNVDNINTYFNFSLTTDDEVTGYYSYAVKGYEYFMNNEINREIYKGPMKTLEVTGKVINIGDTIDIKVSNILTDIDDYKLKNNILGDASIKYVVTIYYNVFSEKLGKSLNEKRELFIEIPTTEISKLSTSETKNEKREEMSELNTNDNKLYLAISLEFLGAIIMFILVILLFVRKIQVQKDQYSVTLEKILKKNKDLIVHISEVPDLSNLDVLFVDDFDDIIDAATNLSQVINYTEVVKGKASIFMVLNKKYAYVYKLVK